MKKLIFKTFVVLVAVFGLSVGASANEGGAVWDKAPNKTNDLPALQHGAKLFVNYCLNCHSAAYDKRHCCHCWVKSCVGIAP